MLVFTYFLLNMDKNKSINTTFKFNKIKDVFLNLLVYIVILRHFYPRLKRLHHTTNSQSRLVKYARTDKNSQIGPRI